MESTCSPGLLEESIKNLVLPRDDGILIEADTPQIADERHIATAAYPDEGCKAGEEAGTTSESIAISVGGGGRSSPLNQVQSKAKKGPKAKDARRDKAKQKKLLKQPTELAIERASPDALKVRGHFPAVAIADAAGNEPTSLLIAHGGGAVEPLTPESYLRKGREFMSTYYRGWALCQQISPIIPAICFSPGGHNEPRNPNVSVYVPPTDPSATRGQDFEERWYNFLDELAVAHKAQADSFPFIVLFRGEYSKFFGKMPEDLAHHLGDLINSNRQDEMVDFVVFVPSTMTVILIECKSEKPSNRKLGSRRTELKRKATDQLDRCSKFLARLFEYIKLKTDQNGGDPNIVRVVAMDCSDAELEHMEAGNGLVIGNDCLLSCKFPDFILQVIGNHNLSRRRENRQISAVTTVAESENYPPFLQLISVVCAQQNVVTGDVQTSLVREMCSQNYLKNPYKRQTSKQEQRILKPEQLVNLPPSFCSVIGKHLLYLSPKQAEALRDQRPFVNILGPPGVGKTLILQLKAIQWCEEGYSVICICNSDGLAEHYKNMLRRSLCYEDEPVFDNSGNVLGSILCQKHTDSSVSDCHGKIIVVNKCKAVRLLFDQRRDLLSTCRWRVIEDEASELPFEFITAEGAARLNGYANARPDMAKWMSPKYNNEYPAVPIMFRDTIQFDEVFRYTERIFTYLKERNDALQRPGVLLAHAINGDKVLSRQHSILVPSLWTQQSLAQLVNLGAFNNSYIRDFLKSWITPMLEAVCRCSSGFPAEAAYYDYRKLAILSDKRYDATDASRLEAIKLACAELSVPTKNISANPSENAVLVANDEFTGLEFEAVISVNLRIDHEEYCGRIANYYKDSRAVATLCPLTILLQAFLPIAL